MADNSALGDDVAFARVTPERATEIIQSLMDENARLRSTLRLAEFKFKIERNNHEAAKERLREIDPEWVEMERQLAEDDEYFSRPEVQEEVRRQVLEAHGSSIHKMEDPYRAADLHRKMRMAEEAREFGAKLNETIAFTHRDLSPGTCTFAYGGWSCRRPLHHSGPHGSVPA